MPETKTYLELSQDMGTVNKFYRVVVNNDIMAILMSMTITVSNDVV
jgi:hypothetical protein